MVKKTASSGEGQGWLLVEWRSVVTEVVLADPRPGLLQRVHPPHVERADRRHLGQAVGLLHDCLDGGRELGLERAGQSVALDVACQHATDPQATVTAVRESEVAFERKVLQAADVPGDLVGQPIGGHQGDRIFLLGVGAKRAIRGRIRTPEVEVIRSVGNPALLLRQLVFAHGSDLDAGLDRIDCRVHAAPLPGILSLDRLGYFSRVASQEK